MWIQFLKHHRLRDEHGRPVMHYPGEDIQIKNKAICQKLIRKGIAIDSADAARHVPPGTGVLTRRKLSVTPHWIEALGLDLEVAKKGLSLPFVLTVIWDPKYTPRREHLGATFKALQAHPWDLAVPIKSYDKLAKARAATVDEHERTRKLIREDRIPYYNTSLMFAKRNERTVRLIKLWDDAMRAGDDECLSFLRALYTVKPYLLPLPVTAATRRRG